MIRWVVGIAVILATLGGSLPASAQAAINIDYVGWHLASNGDEVDGVVLSFDADLIGEYEVTVELLGSDDGVVSSGTGVFTNVTKDDKLVIDLSDAPIEVVYYIRVTLEKLPAVTTNAATGIGTTTATLNGSLTDLGTASSVAVSFEWGTSTAYGNTATVTASPLSAPSAFSATLSGLSSGKTYHFRAKAAGDSTSYGLDRSFTTISPPSPLLWSPPVLPHGTTDVRGMVGDGCRFIEPVSAVSDDELCTLTIPVGTVGLTEDLECLPEITMVTMDDPPPPPEAAHVIGLVYDFGPDGATFDPAITLTFTYDPDSLPEGVSEEDLVIAYFIDGEWIELECVVDTETNTITASVSHFTTFALIGTPPTVVEEEPVVIKKPVVVKKEEVPPVVEEEEPAAVEEEEEPAVVEEEVEPAAVEEEEIPAAAGINWAIIGWIIGGVVVIGLIVFFGLRRRKAS